MRCIAIILVVAVSISCISFPASAAEDFTMMLDLMDYNYVNDGTGYRAFVSPSSSTFFISFPYYCHPFYVELVANIKGIIPWEWRCDLSQNALNVEEIGGGLYRVYGIIDGDNNRITFDVKTTGQTTIDVISCKISLFQYTATAISGKCEILSQSGYSDIINYYPEDELNRRTLGSLDERFNLNVYTDNWKKFDFLDIQLYLICQDITSISCTVNNYIVPIETSIIDSREDGRNSYYITVRVNLTEVKKTYSSPPKIHIEARESDSGGTTISVEYMAGLVLQGTGEQSTSWFKKITNLLSSILDAFTGDNTQVEDNISDAEQKLEDVSDGLDVNTPKPEFDTWGFDAVVSSQDFEMPLLSFSPIYESDMLAGLITLCLVLGLAGFVLYGKK